MSTQNIYKLYSNRSNARRAAKKAGLKDTEFTIVAVGKKAELKAITAAADTKQAPAPVAAPAKAEVPSRKKEKAPKEKKPRKVVEQGRNHGGYNIEKKREKQNGITRYSEGTLGAKLWEVFDKLAKTKGGIHTLTSPLAKEAAGAAGLNPTNAGIEFYVWRRFNGVRGRLNLKKAQKKG